MLVIVVAVALLYRMAVGQRSPAERPRTPIAAQLPQEPVSIDGAILAGSRNARLAMIEYSDFECPYCGQFARESWPAIQDKYVRSGELVVAFRHFPLGFHQKAGKAAEAAMCADAAGKFWGMHDALFANPRSLDRVNLLAHAAKLGIEERYFTECLAGAMTEKVEAERQSGRSIGVSGTPTFFLGFVQPDGRVKVVRRLEGAGSVSEFVRTIDRLKEQVAKDPPATRRSQTASPQRRRINDEHTEQAIAALDVSDAGAEFHGRRAARQAVGGGAQGGCGGLLERTGRLL